MPRYVEGVNYEFLPGETKEERKKRLDREKRARYYGHTKEQHSERNKAWRENNPEKSATRLKRWRAGHEDQVKQQKTEWNRNNLEKVREIRRRSSQRRRKLHPDKVAETQLRWREKDPEKAKLINRAIAARYRERHPDRVKEQQKAYSQTPKRRVYNRKYVHKLLSRRRMAQGLPVIAPHDTAIKKQVFLETFKGCGNLTVSCEAAGCSRSAVAEWRVFDEEFEKKYEEARIQSIEILEAVARQRAMAGSDRLLIFLLRSLKPEMYGQKVEPQVYLRTEAEKLAAEFGIPFEQVYNELLARANERTTSRPHQLVGPGRRATEPAD